jgi:hypothetical protein
MVKPPNPMRAQRTKAFLCPTWNRTYRAKVRAKRTSCVPVGTLLPSPNMLSIKNDDCLNILAPKNFPYVSPVSNGDPARASRQEACPNLRMLFNKTSGQANLLHFWCAFFFARCFLACPLSRFSVPRFRSPSCRQCRIMAPDFKRLTHRPLFKREIQKIQNH